jgi:hypothetical protein
MQFRNESRGHAGSTGAVASTDGRLMPPKRLRRRLTCLSTRLPRPPNLLLCR